MKHFKVVVEHHEDGFVAYPVGLNGVVVGEGDSAEGAIADVKSALEFHIATFGIESLGELTGDVRLADISVAA